MDYKKMIIEMINQIDNEQALEIIYDFVVVPYNREISKNKHEKREN